MKLEFNSKEELTRFIAKEVINSSAAIGILGCSRQNFFDVIRRGKDPSIKNRTDCFGKKTD
ncbi:hypothetical protein SAMN05444972_1075 [Marininema halotolerans]|uniref:Uncharacterized protein n=1 Tax=Marininema halotolerans TaxID=1155944 RepID=A0A1I6SDI9_9BACL|nr:hypothetical protein SAMN05444972_1075 [Marininema halotolerans]